MARVPVSAKTLNALGDGYAGKAIDKALDEINRDLCDRGQDGKVRKLTLTFTFKPSDEGSRVAIDVQSKTTLPPWVPPETHAKYDAAAGGFMFQPEAAGNPDQMTLADASDGRDEE
jgi:hypothetical protein